MQTSLNTRISLLLLLFIVSTLIFVPIDLTAEESDEPLETPPEPHEEAEEEKSIPAVAVIAYQNPYYLSDYDFGIHILDYLEVSKLPYLTEGLTDDSDLNEIARAYEKSTESVTQNLIVNTDDRVKYFVIHLTDSSDIQVESTSSFTFSNFQHSDDYRTFTIVSLPSIDKQEFYSEFVGKYINLGKEPESFDGKIEFVTGDGTILHTLEYENCDITDYSIFLKDDIGIINYIKVFGTEIRDQTTFQCVGVEFQPQFTPKSIETIPSDIPVTNDERAMSFVVSVVDSVDFSPGTSYSFSKFEPVWTDNKTSTGAFGKYDVGFALESLPTKDKEAYYTGVSKYFAANDIEPFDVDVQVITGNGHILQTWNYKNCELTNYSPYLLEFMMVFKFHPDFNSEIRDRSEFECVGLTLDTSVVEAADITKNSTGQPIFDDQRAFYYVVNLVDAPDIESPKTSFAFSSFSYFTDPTYSTYSGIAPDHPLEENVEFLIEGLSGKDKELLYDVISRYVNAGKDPEPFDLDVDLVTGDGNIIQSWEHNDCEVTDFKTFLDDVIVRYKFQRQFQIEIRDTVWFECNGLHLHPELQAPSSDYVAPPLVPVEKSDRANSYIVRLTDAADIDSPKTWYTFGKFLPFAIDANPNTPPTYSQKAISFAIESLPNPANSDFYEIASRYSTSEKDPEPFDMSIEVITTDGHTIQTWNYLDCELEAYTPYTNRNLAILKLHHGLDYEMRDRSIFLCGGWNLDSALKDPTDETISRAGAIPEFDQRALSYVVRIVDAPDIETPQTFRTVSEFRPSFPEPTFTINSLISKEKKNFYDVIQRYVNTGKDPEPFDLEVEVVTGDRETILQTWEYEDCSVTDYVPFTDDNLLFIKFMGEIKSEIIDSTKLDCISSKLDPTIKIIPSTDEFLIESPLKQTRQGISPENVLCKGELSLMQRPSDSTACVKESSMEKLTQKGWMMLNSNSENKDEPSEPYAGIVPDDSSRAMSYTVRITDASDIDTPKSWETFSKFAPYSEPTLVYTELSPVPLGMLPGYSIGDKPQFYLESMPSKDKLDFYEIVSRYINEGKDPEPFDMEIDILSGDNEILQQWDYHDCTMAQFSTFLNEQLLTYKFHEKFTAEFQDRTLFECAGLEFNT